MITTEEHAMRMRIVERIASAMATRSDAQILADIKIQSQRTDEGYPRSAEELDAQNPFITQDDGGRYFLHVRMDGRGQIAIAWPEGPEKTFKFFIPDKYLEHVAEPKASPPSEPIVSADTPKGKAGESGSELKIVMMRIKMGDSEFPIMVGDIPNFPFGTFEEWQQGVIRSRYNICRFSFRQELDIFALVAAQAKRSLHLFGVGLAFLGPIAFIILAFVITPWTLVGLLTFFIGFRIAKSAYDSGIIQAAFRGGGDRSQFRGGGRLRGGVSKQAEACTPTGRNVAFPPFLGAGRGREKSFVSRVSRSRPRRGLCRSRRS